LTNKECARRGILRLPIGLEDGIDLIADLHQALMSWE
jgi:cystathionine beta-lyase/cystathionine gamma-synthase